MMCYKERIIIWKKYLYQITAFYYYRYPNSFLE